MTEEKRMCPCGEEAILYLSTNQFVPFTADDGGWFGGIRREGSAGPVCAKCAARKMASMPNAHHFAYRLDAPYQPDGVNYDDLLRMSVEECAKYRHQSVAEFMRLE